MDMQIAAMSVGIHQAQTAQNLDVAVLKMAMDSSADSSTELLDSLTEGLDPNLGTRIDIQA